VSRLRVLGCWLALLVGCGSSTPEADTATAERSPRDDGCGATCETVDLRGPIAAARLDDDAVAVAARAADGTPLLGVAHVADGRWDAGSLRLRPVEDAPAGACGLALTERAEGALLALGTPEGILLYEVDTDGETTELADLEGPAPARLDVVPAGDDWVVGWLDASGHPTVRALDADGETRAIELDGTEGTAQDIALGLSEQGEVLVRLADGDAGSEVELAGPRLARSGPGGVTIDDAVIDDGRREGEPAHRVGAALALLATEGGWVAAYQDQTDGTLVVTTSGGDRVIEASPGHTRGMHVALARADERAFVLDLGARSTPDVEMEAFVTPVRLR